MAKETKRFNIKKMVTAALCLAVSFLLPFLTGQIPQIGQMLSPMHVGAFLCGFLCGAPYGLLVGAAAPLLRSAVFGMPPMLPTALLMAAEMAAYGAASGILYRVLPKKPAYTYAALVCAMLAGRAVWGAAAFFWHGAHGAPFTWEMFLSAAFITAFPGIVFHAVIVPPIVLALKRAETRRAFTSR